MGDKGKKVKTDDSSETSTLPYTEAETGTESSLSGAHNLCPQVLQEKGYQILKEIGGGAFSKVYKAWGKNKEGKFQTMACKIILISEVPPEWRERCLKTELKIISKVKHENIVIVHEIIKTRTKVFLFMDLYPDTVSDYMKRRRRPLKEKQARFWFRQLMRAIEYIHEHGIAHRDLKTENVLLDKTNNLKLADFGFACFTLIRDNDRGTRTPILMNTACGTKGYMAPEANNGPYDASGADVWSCGVILFEMLTFEKPFDDDLPDDAFIEKQLKRRYKYPDALKEHLSEDLKDLVRQILEPNVDRRLSATGCLKHRWMSRVERGQSPSSD